MKLREKTVYISNKMLRYLDYNSAYLFFKVLHSKKNSESMEQLLGKHLFHQGFISYGGPIIINLSGSPERAEIPAKLPKRVLRGETYTSECMLTVTQYLVSREHESRTMQGFGEFILDDCLELQQHKDENYVSYLSKLEVIVMDEPDQASSSQHHSLLEYSREQLVTSRTLILRELVRLLEKVNILIQARCVFRLGKDLAPAVGEEFITVHKRYVLISDPETVPRETPIIYSNEPVSYLLTEIFPDETYS